jgi:hypothetical protein
VEEPTTTDRIAERAPRHAGDPEASGLLVFVGF